MIKADIRASKEQEWHIISIRDISSHPMGNPDGIRADSD